MNGKERFQRAFAHQEADRVPVMELTIDNPTAETVLGRPTLCGFGGRVRGLAKNQALMSGAFVEYNRQKLADEIELYRALDLDCWGEANPIPRNPLAPEQVEENAWRFIDPTTGLWQLYRFMPESDAYDQVDSSLRQEGLPALERLTESMEASTPRLEDWDFTFVDTAIRELGDELFVLAYADIDLGSTWDWAEHFLIGLIQAPDLIHRYLDAQLRTTLMLLEAMLERGVDGVLGGTDWASKKGPMFSPRHFDKFVFPRLKQITDLCHRYGVPYIKHTDGNVNSLLDGMIAAGVDGFQAIEPVAGMDIAQLKRDYGDRLTLIGNVDCAHLLVSGTIEQVRQQTEYVIRVAAPGGGYVLSTSNSVHPGVKPELYLAMLETAREVGDYPIER
jgi:uroporphyrinogen decarboxylase